MSRSVFSIALFVFAAFGTSSVAAGQTPRPTPDPDDEVIKVESRLIVVPVSVTDQNGQPIIGLTTGDFRVSEENRPQKLESVGNADVVPLEIALLFDVSASTDAMFKFQQATAAKFLKDIMKPVDRATIYTIGQTPVLVQSRDTAERSVASLLSVRTTTGTTAFFDTVAAAARQLASTAPEGTRRVILVISDGEDNFSQGLRTVQRIKESKVVAGEPDPDYKRQGKIVAAAQQESKKAERKKVLRQLNDGDIVFYAINPAGSSYKLNTISVFGQENMQQFADATGGAAFLPKFRPTDTKNSYENVANDRKNAEVLDQIFAQLANELRSQYLIQYYSESDFPANKFVKLSVTTPTRVGSRVRTREGYYVKK